MEQVIFNDIMNDKMFKIVNWTEKVKHFEVSKTTPVKMTTFVII